MLSDIFCAGGTIFGARGAGACETAGGKRGFSDGFRYIAGKIFLRMKKSLFCWSACCSAAAGRRRSIMPGSAGSPGATRAAGRSCSRSRTPGAISCFGRRRSPRVGASRRRRSRAEWAIASLLRSASGPLVAYEDGTSARYVRLQAPGPAPCDPSLECNYTPDFQSRGPMRCRCVYTFTDDDYRAAAGRAE